MYKNGKEIEIALRGEYLYFSTKLESWLSKIMLFIKYEKPEIIENPINFKTLKFHHKIEKVENLLKSLYPEIYNQYKDLFNRLADVKNFRNKIAHCEITWEDGNLDSFDIWDLIEIDKIYYYKAENTSIEFTITQVDLVVKSCNDLVVITKWFQDRFNDKFSH